MTFSDDRPQLVAHRGYSECYPENTLVGLEAAICLGADCIEFDVQYSKDMVPVVIHDDSLGRTSGIDGNINQFTATQLSEIIVGESYRFGDRYKNETIPTLSAVLELLKQWPRITAFVELKSEAIESFGLASVVQDVVSRLKPYVEQTVLISSHAEVSGVARELGMRRTGWVILNWDKESQEYAQVNTPDVLFCNYKQIPDMDGALWQGPWQWALYDIVDPRVALRWIGRGVKFIESWDIGRLLRNQPLGSCLGKIPKKT